MDFFRQYQRTSAHHLSLDEAEQLPVYDTTQVKVLVERALVLLSSDEKIIIHLHYTAGLTLVEISHVLDIGLSAVKMRFYRAIDKLRDAMKF